MIEGTEPEEDYGQCQPGCTVGGPHPGFCEMNKGDSPAVVLALTREEATTLGAALTFALDVVGEKDPQDSTLQGVLDKLRALGIDEQ